MLAARFFSRHLRWRPDPERPPRPEFARDGRRDTIRHGNQTSYRSPREVGPQDQQSLQRRFYTCIRASEAQTPKCSHAGLCILASLSSVTRLRILTSVYLLTVPRPREAQARHPLAGAPRPVSAH